MREDKDGLHAGALLNSSVRGGLEGDRAPTAQALIGCDDPLGASVKNAVPQRFGRESSEYDGVDGTNPGAREHHKHSCWNHGHVNCNRVALSYAVLEQDIRNAADLGQNLRVGVLLRVAGFIRLPNDGCRVPTPCHHVSIDTVKAHVELPVSEPRN